MESLECTFHAFLVPIGTSAHSLVTVVKWRCAILSSGCATWTPSVLAQGSWTTDCPHCSPQPTTGSNSNNTTSVAPYSVAAAAALPAAPPVPNNTHTHVGHLPMQRSMWAPSGFSHTLPRCFSRQLDYRLPHLSGLNTGQPPIYSLCMTLHAPAPLLVLCRSAVSRHRQLDYRLPHLSGLDAGELQRWWLGHQAQVLPLLGAFAAEVLLPGARAGGTVCMCPCHPYRQCVHACLRIRACDAEVPLPGGSGVGRRAAGGLTLCGWGRAFAAVVPLLSGWDRVG